MLSLGHTVVIDKYFVCVLQVQDIFYIMVIWKEWEHEMTNFQDVSDPATIEALLNWELVKYFRVPGMKAYICLL